MEVMVGGGRKVVGGCEHRGGVGGCYVEACRVAGRVGEGERAGPRYIRLISCNIRAVIYVDVPDLGGGKGR